MCREGWYFMAMYLVLLYLAFSLGVFIKLKHYGAPNSAIIYAGLLPIITLTSMLYFSFKVEVKKEHPLFKRIISKVYIFIKLLSQITSYTGFLCYLFGENQIGIEKLLGIDVSSSKNIFFNIRQSFQELFGLVSYMLKKISKEEASTNGDNLYSKMIF